MSKIPPTKPPSQDPTRLPRPSKAHRLAQVQQARETTQQILGYSAREFVLCGLPYKRTKDLVYRRQNGSFQLRLEASPTYGMPFGQDRLVILWLASAFYAARCPQDNTLHLRSAKSLLRAMGISNIGGHELKLLRERLQRIFGATYFLRTEKAPGHWVEQRYHLISKVSLWFDLPTHANQHLQTPNQITLSAEFANDLRRAVVPVDLQSVYAFKESPAVFDLYLWQIWRSYRYAAQLGIGSPRDPHRFPPIRVPLFGPDSLSLQSGAQVSSPRKFRQLLRAQQAEIQRIWPECPNRLSDDGDFFLIWPAQAIWFPAHFGDVGLLRTPGAALPGLPNPELLLERPDSDDSNDPTP